MTERSHLGRDELAALVSAHALRGLEQDEATFVEGLIEDSPEWRAAYDQAAGTLALLARAAPPAQPSAALRERLLTAAREETAAAQAPAPPPAPVTSLEAGRARRDRRDLMAWRLLASALAVAACLAIVFAFTARQDADELRDRAAADAEVAALLAAPGARVVDLDAAGGGPGAAVVVAEGRAPLLVTTLDDAPADRAYQVWAIPADGAPRSIGLFRGGEGHDLLPLPEDAFEGATTIALTVEPEAGSAGPTTAPFLLGDLTAS